MSAMEIYLCLQSELVIVMYSKTNRVNIFHLFVLHKNSQIFPKHDALLHCFFMFAPTNYKPLNYSKIFSSLCKTLDILAFFSATCLLQFENIPYQMPIRWIVVASLGFSSMAL